MEFRGTARVVTRWKTWKKMYEHKRDASLDNAERGWAFTRAPKTV
jgi:hypothetical protein